MTHTSIYDRLVCPVHKLPLQTRGEMLVCGSGDEYPIVESVPVLLVAEAQQTIGAAQKTLDLTRGQEPKPAQPFDGPPYFVDTLGCSEDEKQRIRRELATGGTGVDPVVRYLVGATNGLLYKSVIGNLSSYPIPELRLAGTGRLLDIGCNWGRWCVAAARQGYRPVGIDPSLGAVLGARRVCEQLGVTAEFVVGDARYLPFAPGCFDVVFSYSVVQHFSKEDARRTLAEIGRVLRDRGISLIQMPNAFGIRSLQHQLRRGFRKPCSFEVRYWTIPEMKRAFTEAIGETHVSVDGYFGLGIQASDIDILPPLYRRIVSTSETLRRLSQRAHWMCYFADSVYAESRAGAGHAQEANSL
jgi:SAM-dependent methyltransferase/uncharacterized protein YbaR (Trm112 family)